VTLPSWFKQQGVSPTSQVHSCIRPIELTATAYVGLSVQNKISRPTCYGFSIQLQGFVSVPYYGLSTMLQINTTDILLFLHSIKRLTQKVEYLFKVYYHVTQGPESKWRSCPFCIAISRNCRVVFTHSRELGSVIMRCLLTRVNDCLTNLMYSFK
jgi:hypothetical protein